jgi:6-phospho-3-hexuloisomerase
MKDEHRAIVEAICREIAAAVATAGADAVDQAIAAISEAERIFVFGEGRSGLALRMGAMRLMHLGKAVRIVGDATTPAIGIGDLLIAASGSGATPVTVLIAEQAKSAGASVLAITATPDSRLATLADSVVTLPTPSKAGSSGQASVQPGGSLFEQSLLILLDAIFLVLAGDTAADQIARRHANLE